MPPPYDPTLRRDTPLARDLIARIRRDGPIDTRAYMDACLNDAEHGYYRTRAAIGGTGDFVTAPEISQVFGEIIGLWSAVVWQQMGGPARVQLVEIGAGRGTLLSDALRSAKRVPDFRSALSVHVVEQNPVLADLQRAALADAGPVTWHESFGTLPAGAPAIWIANEFLDTVPVRQRVRDGGDWSEVRIGIDAAGRLAFVGAAPETGDIVEEADWAPLASTLQRHAAVAPLAALFIDYGFTGGAHADTMQAVRNHAAEHVLTSPGEADISCHVAFDGFATALRSACDVSAPLAVDGPVVQSELLGRLGIVERASKLMAANPAQANGIETGVARLIAPFGMGTRFMAIGVRSAQLPTLPGF